MGHSLHGLHTPPNYACRARREKVGVVYWGLCSSHCQRAAVSLTSLAPCPPMRPMQDAIRTLRQQIGDHVMTRRIQR